MSSESRDVESQNFSETGPHFKISHRAPDFTGPALYIAYGICIYAKKGKPPFHENCLRFIKIWMYLDVI
jgi:hypothetical protein